MAPSDASLTQARRLHGRGRKQLVLLRIDGDVLAAGVPDQTMDADAVAQELEALARRAAAWARTIGKGEGRWPRHPFRAGGNPRTGGETPAPPHC